MLNSTITQLKKHFNQERAYAHVAEICQHHRIQASPGYRAAAQYCAQVLEKAGLQTHILSYPGDGKTRYWDYLMPEEWHATQGDLYLLEPQEELLASFERIPISLIQRSVATPPTGTEAELVVLDRGYDEAAYSDIDFCGKIVLTDQEFDKVCTWAVQKRGAIGIITDRMAEFPPVRHRFDLGDALQYTSFWWMGKEKRCFGFVLSPKAGAKLRAKAKTAALSGRRLKLRAIVQASFCEGHIEVVSGLIPGKCSQEVVIVAHLCHPQPSANDNASGSGTVLEVAQTLQYLIREKILPQPKRSIRFLLLPEMAGSYAFLANNEDLIPNMIAALNLDMVGENQDLCQGPLLVERPPHASFSFAGDLMEAILSKVAREVPNLGHTSAYALFKHAVTPFSGGSDHYIFSDPTVGIGSPMLIQWPDKYYHTSMDTLDKVDPQMLKRVGVMTGSYAYFIAQAGPKEAWWLGQHMIKLFNQYADSYISEQAEIFAQALSSTDPSQAAKIDRFTSQHLAYLGWLKREELLSLMRLAPKSFLSLVQKLQRQVTNQEVLLQQRWSDQVSTFYRLYELQPIEYDAKLDHWTLMAQTMIPVRLNRGPISMRGRIEALSAEKQARYQLLLQAYGTKQTRLLTYLLYWTNGQRTLAEIMDKMEHEVIFINREFIVKYVQFLAEINLLKLKQA